MAKTFSKTDAKKSTLKKGKVFGKKTEHPEQIKPVKERKPLTAKKNK